MAQKGLQNGATRTGFALAALLLAGCAVFPSRSPMAYNRALEAFVALRIQGTENGERVKGLCSGVYIAPNQILTARHCAVLEDEKVWVVDSAGYKQPAVIQDVDWNSDLALLCVRKKHSFIRLGRGVVVGQHVYALGCPLGIERFLSDGIVSKLPTEKEPYLLFSAPIQPGNSGGPVVNDRGELVGIVSAIAVDKVPQWSGMSLAVGLDDIQHFLEFVAQP